MSLFVIVARHVWSPLPAGTTLNTYVRQLLRRFAEPSGKNLTVQTDQLAG